MSFPSVMSPASFFKNFTMAKYAKNRNYVPPSKSKTVLVWLSKDKDGVVKQDWDVYIGHGLNNKHWVLEKSKWSNSLYMPKLSAKICNERYRRHILSSKHLQGTLKELVRKRLGCLCPNLDECHGNVLIELVHEFFPSESEMRGYILCHSKVKGLVSQIVTFTILKHKMGHLSMFIRKICGQEYPGRERSCKNFQAT